MKGIQERLGQRYIAGVALAALLVVAVPAIADRWPSPSMTTVSSTNGRYFVRLIPGAVFGDGGNARAVFYERRSLLTDRMIADVRLVNRVGPVDALVSNAGFLITFDNWHEAGYGPVVAIYDPKGSLISAYQAEQLYQPDQLARLPTSVSSRWWRCRLWGFLDAEA